jgi:CHAD domain-containing protein
MLAMMRRIRFLPSQPAGHHDLARWKGRHHEAIVYVCSRTREEGSAIAYRIEKDDHDVIDAIRRIGAEQLEGAIGSVDADGALEPRVHDIRKRMKKMRGLIRLVRPAFPDYAIENQHFRDTARSISGLRDAQVLGQTLERLLERHKEALADDAFTEFRGRIDQGAREGSTDVDLEPAREALVRARERIDLWTLHETGWDAVAGGLEKTYRRARKRQKAKNEAEIHDWRKRLKYHWYHVRLLHHVWPEEMEAREATADQAGDFLGLYQDLVVLEAEIEKGPISEDAARVLCGLVKRRKAETLAEARGIAARLLADKPKALVRRWGGLWETWRA